MRLRLPRLRALTSMLLGTSLDSAAARRLSAALSRGVAERRVPTGTPLQLHRLSDEPVLVDLLLNRDTTLRFLRSGERWRGQVIEAPVRVDTLVAAVQLRRRGGLAEALAAQLESILPRTERAALAERVRGIYAARLDVAHDLVPGDDVRMVIVRERRPDGSLRSHKLLAAEVTAGADRLRAIRVVTRGKEAYVDERGRAFGASLRRFPLSHAEVTSGFSSDREHPILGISRAHTGTDFAAPAGSPVRATGDGTVTFAGEKGGYGTMVELRHRGGYSTRYGHLSSIADGVEEGDRVVQGQVIGFVGSTGLATGPHLHYEVRKNGEPLDPVRARLPVANALSGRDRAAFQRTVRSVDKLLDGKNVE
ncbi:MAG TPA: M23 family metallopeptidase [Longimicrobiales bacterium]|nr:M23 family metallopeptidase [Longimicrobiales bacterium]